MDYSLTPFRGFNQPLSRVFNDFGMTPWETGLMDPFSSFGWNRGGLLDTPGRRALNQEMSKFSPILSADIVESNEDFHVFVDLPGVHKNALSVSIDQGVGDNGSLHIEANRDDISEDDTEMVHRRERNHGRVTRTLPIPLGADPQKVKTLFENGMLKVSFKKQANAKKVGQRRLQIEG